MDYLVDFARDMRVKLRESRARVAQLEAALAAEIIRNQPAEDGVQRWWGFLLCALSGFVVGVLAIVLLKW